MIPKKIHYVWFGKGEMNNTLKNCIRSWKRVLPDYEIKCWNEDNSPMDYPYMRQMLKYKKYAMISDYLRVYSLFNEGGIYLDTDVEVIKPLDPFLNDRCFIGFQQEESSSHWVNCAVMGAEKGHIFLSDCMELFNDSQRRHTKPLLGTDICTLVLENYGLKKYGNQRLNDVNIFEHEYFYPYHFTESYNKKCIGEKTYCVHHWQISWKSKKGIKAKISEIRYFISRLLTIFFNIK